MNIAPGEAKPSMQEQIVKRRMLVHASAAEEELHGIGGGAGGMVDDRAFVVDFSKPTVARQ